MEFKHETDDSWIQSVEIVKLKIHANLYMLNYIMLTLML